MFEALPVAVRRQLSWRDYWPALLLAFLWLTIGFFHQPWLPNETTSFAVILGQLTNGLQVAPLLGSQVFVEHPPLLFWSSTISATALQGILPLHDGARLASAAFTLITFSGIALAGHFGFSQPRGHVALLALLASLGFMLPSHGMVPALTAAAGTSLILAAFALYPTAPQRAALLASSGAVIGFLGHGIMTPLAFYITLLILPLLPTATQPAYRTFARSSMAISLPLLLLWPLFLGMTEPQHLHAWLQQEGARLSFSKPLSEQLETLSWFTWPTLPLVLLGGWQMRHRLEQWRPLFPAMLLALCWLIFSLSSLRELDKLPLLLPLALLAAATTEQLRKGAANGFYWFGMMSILFFAGLFWFYWSVLTFGWPEKLASHLARMAPGHMPDWSWHALLAVLLTLGWLLMLRWRRKSSERCILWVWASGTTLTWGMIMLLLSGWLDYSRSLYPLAQQVRAVLPAQQACVNLSQLSDTHRVLFDYYLALPQHDCAYTLLEQSANQKQAQQMGKPVWQGQLPASRSSRFELRYQPLE